jgi:hypothetical protein
VLGVGEPLVFEIDMLCATLSCAPSALRASIGLRSFPDPYLCVFATLREIFWSSIRVNSRPFAVLFVLFAPFCGYYVFLAPLNMPVSVICFALGYRLCA